MELTKKKKLLLLNTEIFLGSLSYFHTQLSAPRSFNMCLLAVELRVGCLLCFGAFILDKSFLLQETNVAECSQDEINRVGIAILCQKSGLSLTILQQEPGFCKSEHVSLAETRTTCWLRWKENYTFCSAHFWILINILFIQTALEQLILNKRRYFSILQFNSSINIVFFSVLNDCLRENIVCS